MTEQEMTIELTTEELGLLVDALNYTCDSIGECAENDAMAGLLERITAEAECVR